MNLLDTISTAISNDSDPSVTPLQTIDAIKAAGFKHVFLQWYNKDWEISQQQQYDYVKQCGLIIDAAHLGYQGINNLWLDNEIGEAMIERYKNDIQICSDLGIKLVMMHLTAKSEAPIYNEIGIRRLQKIADFAQQLGVKIAFENTKIKGYLEYVIEHINNENVGICFDAGHCHAHFEDEFNYDLFKGRIFAIHLHDNEGTSDQHLIPFEGTIDWKKVLGELKRCGYEGPITLELCYRNEYLKQDLTEFYKKGLESAKSLAQIMSEA